MTMAFVNAGRGVDVWIVRGRSWWSERQPRERLLLCGLAVLLALAVIINGIARPLIEVRREARAEIALFDALEVRLRAAGPNLRPPTSTIAGGSLQTVATMTAAEAALPIREIAEQGETTVVAFDSVNFVALMTWIDRLEREQGVMAQSAEIERQTAPGIVNARLTLARP